jgi:N-succinyldiaminopimelate aminotransferase
MPASLRQRLFMRPVNATLASLGTTIFTVMSALAVEHRSINLGQGFPDTDGPPDILDAADVALRDGRNQYPPMPGVPELRRAVAAANARFYGIEVDPAREVVVTSGATEAITACLMALLNPGDEVVVIEPVYDTYLPVIRMLGAVPRIVRLTPPEWSLPHAELADAFGPRTKAILLNTPMNPTGKVFTQGELGFIAELLMRHDAYAVCDEVYEHLVFDDARHLPLMSLPGMRERAMRIGSAGKTFSLTGWKVGYVTACAALAEVVAKAHQNLTFTTPPNLQRAVAVGLAKDDAYFAGLAATLQAKRDRLAAGLASLGMTVLPSCATYFVTADFTPLGFPPDDEAFCRHITEHAKVTAVPVTAFYDAPDPPRSYARFAFCKRDEVLDEAVARLRRHFRERNAATLTTAR